MIDCFIITKSFMPFLEIWIRKIWKSFCPPQKTFEIEGKKFALMHGWGSPKNLHKKIEKKFENYKWDILIFGHTHSAAAIEKDNKLILNPGSPTEKRFAKKNTYIKLILDKNKVNYELVEI
ncbi:MAG: YfcE family phosphodiesterase [Candidatus Mcinerneyibacterium aminivorans]|uniref:Phosphoesterase n=1 Tax=Candidatus Mcinerneyibacterium aminivorans TaxID=2703815 RepID=A0A5D0MKQ8_9BACT|nr:MAG: YfcE family phosphodiesterase [Candidatus Mcinerneyibacterium aminivorans]